MNAPLDLSGDLFDDEKKDPNKPWRDIFTSNGLSFHARLVWGYLFSRARWRPGRIQRPDGVWLSLDAGDAHVECSIPKVARYLGMSERNVKRAIAELERAGLLVDTGKCIERVTIRHVVVRRVEAAGRVPRAPSLYLGKPKQVRKRRRLGPNSASDPGPNSHGNSGANSALDPGPNSHGDLGPNLASNSSGVLSSSEFDLTSLPITHVETAGEEGDEVSIEQPDAPCVEPLPRSATIDRDRGTPDAGGTDRASETLKDAIRRIARQPNAVWSSNDPAKRLRLLEQDSDPSNPANRRRTPPLITHAEFAWRRGYIDRWCASRFIEAVRLEALGENPLARGTSTGPTREEKAKFKAEKEAQLAAEMSKPGTIELDPANFGANDGGMPDVMAMMDAAKSKLRAKGELKAHGVEKAQVVQ